MSLSEQEYVKLKEQLESLDRQMAVAESKINERKAVSQLAQKEIEEAEQWLVSNGVDVANLDRWVEKELASVIEEAEKVKTELAKISI